MKVLIVEDERITRQKLLRHLSQWGYQATGVGTGDEAWAVVEQNEFSVVITGLVMPGLTGFELLQRIRARTSPENYTYVIVVTGRDETEDVIQALNAGADDCLTKPLNPGELHARLRTADRIISLQSQLVAHHQQMTAELDAAARYMRTMVPAPLESPLKVDWRYIPCAHLSGDGFGYRWIDDDHFAMYLLDVSGHGIDAALLSASVMNVIRSGNLLNADLRQPGQVMESLNNTFCQEGFGDRYFTMWYGVYCRSKSELSWAGGGHPPALLILPELPARLQQLKSTGPVVGVFPSPFGVGTSDVPSGSRLCLYSDGVHEILKAEGGEWTFHEFVDFLQASVDPQRLLMDDLLKHVQGLRGSTQLDDDFTMIEIGFPPVG